MSYTRRQGLILGAALALGIPKAHCHTPLPSQVSLSLRHAVGDPRAVAWVQDLQSLRLYSSQDGAALTVARSPGSLVKLLTAALALEQQVITPRETLFCPGWRDLTDGSRRPCWDPRGHGDVNVISAIAHSCNVFFYQVGERLGSLLLRQALAEADLVTLSAGQAPLLATGEDPHCRVTPLALLHWLRGLITAPLTPERLLIREGMIQAVTQGTCQGLHHPGGVAAKTGTILHQGQYQGWVAAYTPIQYPRWLILVYVPTGRAYQVGIPVAQRVLTWTQGSEG